MTKTDTAGFEVLAENYREEAELCRRMAGVAADWRTLSGRAARRLSVSIHALHFPTR
jgi:hypothetical protein